MADAQADTVKPEEQVDTDIDDLFESEDEAPDLASPPNETAKLTSAPNVSQPKSTSQQKPSANTRASVDDQIAELAKHAGKLKLEDKLAGGSNRKIRREIRAIGPLQSRCWTPGRA